MDWTEHDRSFMQQATQLQGTCQPGDTPPQGAVLVKQDSVVSTGLHCRHATGDPIRFAEMDCIANAGRRSDHAELTLYSTGTPNWLAAGTIVQFGIGALVHAGDPLAPPVVFLKSKGITIRHWDPLGKTSS